MNNTYTIYVHENKVNGKLYIGQTSQKVERRWLNGEGYRTQSYFYNAIQKYGWNNFNHIILFENLSLDEANIIEEYLIKKYKTLDRKHGYNRKFGGENYHVNVDAKNRMSKRHANFSGKNNPHYGKSHSEETRKRISQTKKEKYSKENHPMYGKNHSIKAKLKMSDAKGVKVNMYDLKENFIKSFNSIAKASTQMNIDRSCISMCCRGKLKTSGGYIWKYAS